MRVRREFHGLTRPMLPARTFSVSIPCDWRALYEQIWRPAFFARWASGLTDSDLVAEGDDWVAEGPEGPIRLRFTPHNDFGVMDHWVDAGTGAGAPALCVLATSVGYTAGFAAAAVTVAVVAAVALIARPRPDRLRA